MAKKTIMLVCSAGMSTSLLVTKMQKAAEDRGMEADIFAVSASEADTNLENKEVNVLLLGPQVRFMKGQFEQKLQPKGIPLDVINMADYGMMNGVKTVDIFDTLKAHKDEYIFFRTDHHWTADGAYYAYEDFCKTKGITAIPRDKRKTDTFKGFLGSFYSTLQNSDMKNNPDTIYAYEPIGTNDMTYWNEDGSEQKWNVIMDVNGWDKGTMYSTFVGGDTPMAVIENPNVTDGSSCVVMKESYGNAFIPFLVDHYSKIYIIDYRYSQVNILDFVKSKKVNDFICINNISLIGDKDVAATISSLLH